MANLPAINSRVYFGKLSVAGRDAESREDPMWRFGAKVTPQPNGCWAFRNDLSRYHPFDGTVAHRWVWQALGRNLPEGYVLHHKCENKGCVNPEHLEPMTRSDHSSHHATLQHAASPRPQGS